MGVGVNGDGDLDVGLCRCGSCTAAASTASCLLATGFWPRSTSTVHYREFQRERAERNFNFNCNCNFTLQRTTDFTPPLGSSDRVCSAFCVRPAIRVREARRRSPRRLWYHLSLSACSSTHRRMTRTPPRPPKRSWRQRCLRNRDRA